MERKEEKKGERLAETPVIAATGFEADHLWEVCVFYGQGDSPLKIE